MKLSRMNCKDHLADGTRLFHVISDALCCDFHGVLLGLGGVTYGR